MLLPHIGAVHHQGAKQLDADIARAVRVGDRSGAEIESHETMRRRSARLFGASARKFDQARKREEKIVQSHAEGAPEVARQMREAAQGLERLASSWERRSQEKPPMSVAPRVDDLLADTNAFTPADYQRERAALEQRFLTKHGTCAEDIDAAICRGALPCDDPLVEEWTALQALAPYMTTKDD
jgi:hypothetical protein